MIKNYKLLESQSSEDLELKVNELISQGYIPQGGAALRATRKHGFGGAIYNGSLFSQAMVFIKPIISEIK